MKMSNRARLALDCQSMSEFLQRYPLKLRDACLIPVIERVILAHFGMTFPWPAQPQLERFLLSFGYSQGAIRTALSRARAQGELVTLDTGQKRLQAGELMSRYTALFLSEPFSSGEFSLLLFHFATDQTRERSRLKESLDRFNFRLLTQNAYLRYGARSAEIQAFLEQQGFGGHIYCFQNLPELPERLIQELPGLYQLPLWAERLKAAERDFAAYLRLPGTVHERYWRYLFARASFHANVLTQAPFLPEVYFPDVRLTREIFASLTDMAQLPEFISAYGESFT